MDSLPVNVLDLVVLVVLLLSAVLSFFRGFVHETLGIAAWVGAGLAALFGLPLIRDKVRELIPVTWAADAAAAVAIFLVVLLLLSIITRGISRKVQDSSLGSVDRSLGVLFGLARGAFLVGLAYIVIAWLIPPADHPDWVTQARGLPLIRQSADMIRSVVPSELGLEEAADTGRTTAEDAIELKRSLDTLIQPQVRQPEPAPAPAPAPSPAPAPQPRTVIEPSPVPAPQARPQDPGVGYGDDERQDLDRLFETAR